MRLRNAGRQFHEINLVEMTDGKTIDDVVAWFKHPVGAPPMKSRLHEKRHRDDARGEEEHAEDLVKVRKEFGQPL